MSNANGHQTNGAGYSLVPANGRTHGPDAVVAAHDLYWDGLSPAVTLALHEPLDDRLVSRRRGRGGRTLSYIEGHTAIDEANRVFGYGGWGFEVVEPVTVRRVETADSRTGEVRATEAYTALVRVTVPGAPPRTDVGFHAVTDETADGHETAIKGAVTDGMKRALRSFGNRFGNGLYGEHPPVAQQARPERAPARASANDGRGGGSRVETLRRRLVELGAEQGFNGERVRKAVTERTGKDLDELTAEELALLVESSAAKLRRRRRAQAAGPRAEATHGPTGDRLPVAAPGSAHRTRGGGGDDRAH